MSDLPAELERRRSWFFETQLRRLNLQSLRAVPADSADPVDAALLELISAPAAAPPPGTPADAPATRTYLDSEQPVWTKAERERREKYTDFIGALGNWLDFEEPFLLRERVAELAAAFEQDRFGSDQEKSLLAGFRRRKPTEDGRGVAISRAVTAAAKPWLLGELYCLADLDTVNPATWFANLERFLTEYEAELRIAVGERLPAFDPADEERYRAGVRAALADPKAFEKVGVQLGKIPNPYADSPSHRFNAKVTVPPAADPVDAEAFSGRMRYWSLAVHYPLAEVYVSKENSDMGLCQLIRMLYLFGTMPAHIPLEKHKRWRERSFPVAEFDEFFGSRAGSTYFTEANTENRAARLDSARRRLRIIMAESVQAPGSAAVAFSPIAQEILRQGIRGYKFWLDEPFHTLDSGRLVQLNPIAAITALQETRIQLGYGGDIYNTEMEYWSENHYIMFASSEYLAGQLWEHDEFQAAAPFLEPGSRDGVFTGAQRRDRGKARVLKWLNHRLLFGWTEFNSSGYYREHLWSLLNLVDFALDEEVRDKATLAADLLLFDVARYLHKGAMGAVGGRSQFKSKCSGVDNGMGDAIEIMFGTRGLFADGDSEIGAAFATSTYQVPEVLQEIAVHPPAHGFTDRSRVSIDFGEAPKYGLVFSQQSDEIDSLRAGYAQKLADHFKFIDEVNTEIENTHPGYSREDDSFVFWWSTSAFFNKQVITGTYSRVERWGLEKNEVFSKLSGLLSFLAVIEGLGDASVGAIAAGPAGAVYGLFEGEKKEDIADSLSLFLEGSTRTRANIMTYKSPDIMLSSIQSFRVGQMNVQSNVSQATVNGAVNVFSTSGFEGFDISPLLAGLVGGLAGLAIGGVPGAVLGAAGGVIGNELAVTGSTLGNEHDGLGWLTGYWALPMVAQGGNAAIVAYDFTDVQHNLTDCGSHFWFPRRGFDQTDEVRCSNYQDANSPLFEIFDVFHYGPKGFWVFGKYVHPVPGVPAADRPEAYIGVFSNQRPTWMDTEEGPSVYDNAVGDAADRDIAATYFKDQDWYVEAKNIWIMQVGTKADYGDYETFKQRVSSARVYLDDNQDMEVNYHMPVPGGGSQVLALKYEEREAFFQNKPLPMDLYPRFENPFVRGGTVEWGQRGYVIEYNGKLLRHDYFDYRHPVRDDDFTASETEQDQVKALVVHVRTTDEDMDEKTVGAATVRIGCSAVATDQVIAVGPADDHTSHDAEWVFFSGSAQAAPDSTIELRHRAVDDGDDEADWNMSFSVKALMGDYTLRECALSDGGMDFDEDHRSTGIRPFSIRTDRWRSWEAMPNSTVSGQVTLATRPPYQQAYYDYIDLLVAEPNRPLRHRKIKACLSEPAETAEVPGSGPSFPDTCTVRGVSRAPGRLVAVVLDSGALYLAHLDGGRWTPWQARTVSVEGGSSVPLATPGTLYAGPTGYSADGIEVVTAGADGHLYADFDWRPGDSGAWYQLAVQGFTLRTDGDIALTDKLLFALDTGGALWSTPIVRGQVAPSWTRVSPDGLSIRTFTTTATEGGTVRVLANVADGNVWDGLFAEGKEPQWTGLGLAGQPTASRGAGVPAGIHIATAVPYPKHLDAFTVANDGVVQRNSWADDRGWSGWTPIVAKPQPFAAAARTPLVVHRVNRQLELYAQSAQGDLYRAWWS
ncbi:hypothetical protein [Nocardia sp. NPDC051832]|uniref:hypothetical protein n=1 Tax=Nocardia sp. NPDC051832 TaxID=3155673 RepID=UPI00343E057D